MKRLTQFFIVSIILSTLVSCSKDETEPNNAIEKEILCAKWNVNETNDFESFEFNESGNYIIVKNNTSKSTNNQNIIFGTYDIINNTIVLSDFGTINISEINDSTINFILEENSSSGIDTSISATKQVEMQKTAKTLLLCKTWKVVSYNDQDVLGTEYDATILFSATGTYFVKFAVPDEDFQGGLAQWRWKDETETKFLYTWEPPIWNEQDEVEITELTNDVLKFYADFDEFYVLEPLSN